MVVNMGEHCREQTDMGGEKRMKIWTNSPLGFDRMERKVKGVVGHPKGSIHCYFRKETNLALC